MIISFNLPATTPQNGQIHSNFTLTVVPVIKHIYWEIKITSKTFSVYHPRTKKQFSKSFRVDTIV